MQRYKTLLFLMQKSKIILFCPAHLMAPLADILLLFYLLLITDLLIHYLLLWRLLGKMWFHSVDQPNTGFFISSPPSADLMD